MLGQDRHQLSMAPPSAEEDFDNFMRTYVGAKKSGTSRGARPSSGKSRSSRASSRLSRRSESSKSAARPSAKSPSQRPSVRDSGESRLDREVQGGGSLLGLAGVAPENESTPDESDATVIAPLTDELGDIYMKSPDGNSGEPSDGYAEGEDFLRSVTQEFESE